ncbi:MAG TPA: ABC transporter permease [Methanomicrobiales archaeon]|nr:ABC transporter permease [Methanomicrobiales archaeon]
MDFAVFVRSILVIAEKNIRIYYWRGPVVVFGLLFPFLMFFTYFIGRSLDLVAFFPGFLGMMLFFTSSSVGPLVIPWEKREKTYERLLAFPVLLESIILGDIVSGMIFGLLITGVVLAASMALLHLPVASVPALLAASLLGSVAFAALGTLFASMATDVPSNVMMLSSLVRLPLIFVSGIFIPISQLTGWEFVLTSLSPLTYLVDLFHAALTGDGVYPPAVDALVLIAVIVIFILLARTLQERNLVKGL